MMESSEDSSTIPAGPPRTEPWPELANAGGGPGLFPPTHWSMIHGLQSRDEIHRNEGLARFCSCYWKPVAADLTQDFFSRLIAGNWLTTVREEKGRLRSFLLVLLKRHAANAWEYRQAKKRGGGGVMIPIDGKEAEAAWSCLPSDGASPDVLFDRQWAVQLLEEVMNCLRAIYVKSGREELFDELREYITASGSTQVSYAGSALRLGMNESAVKVAAFRLRERYRNQLRKAVEETVGSSDAVDEEIDWLFRVFQ